MLNGLDLFTGIGGITYALQDYIKPIAYCEIDPFCQSVLLSRMQEGDLPKAPIWDDIREFNGSLFRLEVDIITGGFPCQDISCAGKGKGLEGERSGLFFEIMRVAKEIKPRFLFLENVPAITASGGLRVVREIATLGYDCRWCVISAASVGALHKRERWFLLANSQHYGASANKDRGSPGKCLTQGKEPQEQEKGFGSSQRTSSLSPNVANTPREESRGLPIGEKERKSCSGMYGKYESIDEWQKIVSSMGKCSDGISHRVDRLKALGNSVVPQQVKKAWKILWNG